MTILRVFPFRFPKGEGHIGGAPLGRGVLRVPPYGFVEGVLYEKGKPASAGVGVTCLWRDSAYYTVHHLTLTDDGGRFVFGPLPCGEVCIGRYHGQLPVQEEDVDSYFTCDVERRVNVLPGVVKVVELGAGPGRISGRLKISGQPSLQSEGGAFSRLWLECLGPHPDPEMNLVTEYVGRDWRGDDDPDIEQSGGVPDRASHRWYLVEIQADGTFSRDGIWPGDYGLRLECGASDGLFDGPLAVGFHRLLVDGNHELGDIEVPRWNVSSDGTGRICGTLSRGMQPAPRGIELMCRVAVTVEDDYGDWTESRSVVVDEVEKFAETGDDGDFVFEGLPRGNVTIGQVIRRSEDAYSMEVLAELKLGEGEELRLELRSRG